MAEPWQLQLYRRSFKKKQTMKALLDHLPPVEGRRCLELGCATGLTSYFLRQRGGSWLSCDFERDHVRSARLLLGGGVLQTGEGEVPFRDASFDVVVAINFLEHIRDDGRYFRDMVRVLKPGGDLLFMAPKGEKGRPGYAVKKLLGFTADQGGFGHARDGYPPAAARELFRANGVEVQGEAGYCRFFTEFLEDLLNFVYHRKAAAATPEGGEDFHGATAPMSEDALKQVGLAYRVFAAVHPLLRLWTTLDALIPFDPGYMMVMWGKKKAS
jgi:SAM-dependent methyltransferase